MNAKIKTLQTLIEHADAYAKAYRLGLTTKLQAEWTKVFDKDANLAKALSELESSTKLDFKDAEIIRWIGFDTSPYTEAKEYLDTYVQDNYCAHIDWDNSNLYTFESDCIIIQHGGRDRDNGVYYGHKQIVPESAYRTDDNNIDLDKRDELIEAYMEKQGEYPSVVSLDQHGNLFYVNTKESKS